MGREGSGILAEFCDTLLGSKGQGVQRSKKKKTHFMEEGERGGGHVL